MIRTVVDANTATGAETWSSDFVVESPEGLQATKVAAECDQGYAQARIFQLLEYNDAERALGSDLLAGLSESLPASSDFKQLAKELALDAGLVWPGLTAMVTVETDSCRTTYDVCYDGEATFNEEDRDGLNFNGEDTTAAGYAGSITLQFHPICTFMVLSVGLAVILA